MKTRRLFLVVGGGVLVLAVGFQVARGMRAADLVTREVASLREEGLLAPADGRRVARSGELELARYVLAAHLKWVSERSQTEYRGGFGGLWMLTPENRDAIERGLQERAPFLEGLDGMPSELWEQHAALPGATRLRTSSPRMDEMRAAANALCARAWLAAREPENGERAGRSLAQAFALARVTDDGLSSSLAVRCATELIVLDALARIESEKIVPAEALLAPLRAELERAAAEDRLRLALKCDVRYYLVEDESGRRRFFDPLLWLRMPTWLESRLKLLRDYHEIMGRIPRDILLARADDTVVELLGELGTRSSTGWREIALVDRLRHERIAAALKPQ